MKSENRISDETLEKSVKPEKSRKKNKGVLGRIIKLMFSFYPVLLPITLICVVITAVISSIPAMFMQKVIRLITIAVESGSTWSEASGEILHNVLILGILYVISLCSFVVYSQMLAVITQGTIKKLREKMFNGMQNLPIKYFDTHNHGDIMSYYTNDTDSLSQLISQSIPQILSSGIVVLTVFAIMLYYCLWLTLIAVFGTVIMVLITKKVGGVSSRGFIRQQKVIGKEEGFIEEMMNGQKVVKVFCHEKASVRDFDAINEELFAQSRKANRFANILAPILNNIGNILYVIVAVSGGAMLILGAFNISVSGLPLGIDIVVPFLNMTRQFAGNINQVSMQINSVVMGLAGARRLFELIDEKPEVDDGYVSLVNAKEQDGEIVPCKEHTGLWAWQHPHHDGTVTYTKLEGDVVLQEVDFEYEEGKRVLNDVSIYAKPGQKVALVGSTGAGKTTITNLINRFYDIADGKIRYDGININKIKKADLRKSLGIVLQDTNLFTGTVMENIRYGRLDASDDECIAAAKLAGADDFIMRLPDGYETRLSGNGANLSQGQRQLLSIARAAVADPPVMILDEATSSIDTRTEAIVSRGMDALMQGRTVFVIAHRLSTIKNSDVIIVLEHGRIIERGSHEQLLEEKGKYYQLYTGAFEME